MRLQEKFKELEKECAALLATNFYNFETLKGVLLAAAEMRQPLILQATESSIKYMGLDITVNLARTASEQYEVKTWLHLDHARSYRLIKSCLEAGFDSVMIDASEEPFEKNIKLSLKVVELAQKFNANVEAELGYVAKLGQKQAYKGFTEPEEAKRFVEETGVDALAVAIGSSHGFYEEEPDLDLERLSEIYAATDAALVLHGGSGIPDAQLQEGIRRGIRKINVATEIKNTFISNLQEKLAKTDEIDLRKVFPAAINEITTLIKHKLKVVSEA